jgi:hypothetical protein
MATVDVETLLADIANLCDEINLEMSNAGKLSVNFLFDTAFHHFRPSSTTDPVIYIPEFCREFAVLAESVRCLDSFALILGDIFDNFDCRLESFKPATLSFAFIRNQVLRLQTLLNEISPKPIHRSVFLVLSRFISLSTSFVSAIATFSVFLGKPQSLVT